LLMSLPLAGPRMRVSFLGVESLLMRTSLLLGCVCCLILHRV
jgi:hypothetical protein